MCHHLDGGKLSSTMAAIARDRDYRKQMFVSLQESLAQFLSEKRPISFQSPKLCTGWSCIGKYDTSDAIKGITLYKGGISYYMKIKLGAEHNHNAWNMKIFILGNYLWLPLFCRYMSLQRYLWHTTPEEIFTCLNGFFPLERWTESLGKPPLSFIPICNQWLCFSFLTPTGEYFNHCVHWVFFCCFKIHYIIHVAWFEKHTNHEGIKQQPGIQVTAGNFLRYSKLFTSPFTFLQSLPHWWSFSSDAFPVVSH